MSIAIKCSECGKSYQWRDDLAGKRVRCKCGQAMLLPSPDSEADDAVYGLAPLDASDPANMLETPPPLTAGGPVLPRPTQSAADSATERASEREASGWDDLSPTARKRIALGTVFGLLGGTALFALVVLWLIYRPGFASPEKAFAAYQQAIFKKDWNGLIRAHSPPSRETMLSGSVAMLGWMLKAMEVSSPGIEAALEKHGVGELLDTDDWTDASAEDSEDAPPIDYAERARKREERRKQLLSSVESKVALFVDLMEAVEVEQEKHLPQNPLLAGMAKKPEQALRRAIAAAKLAEVKIDGDSAAGTMTFLPPGDDEEEEAPVFFKRVDGRWYVHIPGPEDYRSSPFPDLIGGGLFL